jgi:hypothetical protein
MKVRTERPEPIFLVCAPADSPWAVPGSIFTRVCLTCFTRVMIAPSGQRFLQSHPEASVICERCIPEDEPVSFAGAAADLETLVAEIKQARPNLYRDRN